MSKSIGKKATGSGSGKTNTNSNISNSSSNKGNTSSRRSGKPVKKPTKTQEHISKRTNEIKDSQQQTADATHDSSMSLLLQSEPESELLNSPPDRYSAKFKKAQTISLSLLAKRCISDYHKLDAEQIMKLLNDISHVRLDRENLQNIDGLELLGANVKNLYLQHNEVSTMEGLETLTGLRFLTLSHNKINRIQNIKNTKIGFLDISHNDIDELEIDELPKSLVILNLEGNACRLMDGYKEEVLKHCPQLSQLDGDRLTAAERRSAGHEVISDSEGSDDEGEAGAAYDYDKPFGAEVIGVFDDMSSDIFLRCQSRIQHVYAEHKARVIDLDRIKAVSGISTEDGISTGTSRVSSRFDSPDTTDSSRPTTGNTGPDDRPFDSEESDVLRFRLAHMKMTNATLLADKIGQPIDKVVGAPDTPYFIDFNNDDSAVTDNDTELLASGYNSFSHTDKGVNIANIQHNAWESNAYASSRPTMSMELPRSTRPKSRKM